MSNSATRVPPRRTGPPEFTTRFLVLGSRPQDAALPRMLRDKAGLTIASSSDFPRGDMPMDRPGGADGIYLDRLGVVVTDAAPDQLLKMGPMAAGGDQLVVERERVVYGLHVPQRPGTYGAPQSRGSFSPAGIDDAVGSRALLDIGVRVTDEAGRTWGLVATKVASTSRTGRSVRLAVLDTGLDLQHPDFANRAIVSRSFIEGQGVQDAHDGHSHGTHCAGIAAGPAQPGQLPRYGVAGDASLFVGKVLNDDCRGRDGWILAGLDWALAEGCRVVSMSIGSSFMPGDRYSQVYETVGQRALAANAIIVAAAGNESDRENNLIAPVGHPANCPSIMAVGAVDSDMQIASFSCRGSEPNGGGIDIVGPGVDVYSTVPMPGRYRRQGGTSMACPYVAGIAALYMEANPNASARDIWKMLTTNARTLTLEVSDMGAGLVQAPL